jgi:hypothetical protein
VEKPYPPHLRRVREGKIAQETIGLPHKTLVVLLANCAFSRQWSVKQDCVGGARVCYHRAHSGAGGFGWARSASLQTARKIALGRKLPCIRQGSNDEGEASFAPAGCAKDSVGLGGCRV